MKVWDIVCDDDIRDLYGHLPWYVDKHGTVRVRLNDGNTLFQSLHRLVMNPQPYQEVDHINGNQLDNRRANLRFCTRQQNNQNKGIRSDNKSGFKGVSWDKLNKKWVVRILVNGKYHNIGRYTSVKEAALAYNKMATKHYGEFARLNEVKL